MSDSSVEDQKMTGPVAFEGCDHLTAAPPVDLTLLYIKCLSQNIFFSKDIAKHLAECHFRTSTNSLTSLSVICIHLYGSLPVDILHYYTIMTSLYIVLFCMEA